MTAWALFNPLSASIFESPATRILFEKRFPFEKNDGDPTSRDDDRWTALADVYG